MFQLPWLRFTSPQPANRPASHRRLSVESLERRELLTATLQSSLALATASGQITPKDVVNDASGNTYIAGALSSSDSTVTAGPVDFDPLNAYPDNRDIVTAPQNTTFIVKYNAAGEFDWVRASTGNNTRISKLAIGGSGDVYFSGTHSGTMAFGGVTSAGAEGDNRFAGRLDAAGNALWLKSMNLAGIEFDTAGLAVDEAHNRVYLAGTQMLTNPGSRDGIVAALNTSSSSNVTVAWTVSLIATSSQYSPASADAIAVDGSGEIYVGGSFQGSADFDPGSGKLNLSSGSGGRFDIPTAGYVWKLSASGSVVWADVFAGGKTANSVVTAIAVDASNNVIVAGSFAGAVDFQPGRGTVNLPSDGADVFLVKLNAAGAMQYAKSMLSVGHEGVEDVVIDPAGNILVAGRRSNSASDGAFVARFSATGNLMDELRILGAALSSIRISVNPLSGKLHVIGSFNGPVDLNGDGVVDHVSSSSGANDLFWATYGL
jgi:hypothetical protein